jgi:hypothetical protein
MAKKQQCKKDIKKVPGLVEFKGIEECRLFLIASFQRVDQAKCIIGPDYVSTRMAPSGPPHVVLQMVSWKTKRNIKE